MLGWGAWGREQKIVSIVFDFRAVFDFFWILLFLVERKKILFIFSYILYIVNANVVEKNAKPHEFSNLRESTDKNPFLKLISSFQKTISLQWLRI